MSRLFRYWRDPVCVVAIVLYVVHRWLVPVAMKGPILRNHFADLLFVPAALPLWLWLERRLGWRTHDEPPRWAEIGFVLLVWTVAAELIAPRLFANATGDMWDAVAYAVGAVIAGVIWRWR